MKDFKQILEESIIEFKYRIKSVVEIDDNFLEKMESVLKQFHVTEILEPIKTIIQDRPMDFIDIENSAVWITEFTTSIPISSAIFMEQLTKALGISENMVVVRSLSEPAELNRQKYLMGHEADAEALEKGLSLAAHLSCDPSYPEAPEVDQLYGDKYNSDFLNFLAQVEQERPSQKVDAISPLFKWLDMPKQPPGENSAFNKDIDSVKPVYSVIKKRTDYKLDPTGIVPNDMEMTKMYSKGLDAKPVIIKRSL